MIKKKTKTKLKSLVSLLLCAVLAFQIPAQAAEEEHNMSEFLTDVSLYKDGQKVVTGTELSKYDSVMVEYSFEIPDTETLKTDGTKYWLDLPRYVKLQGESETYDDVPICIGKGTNKEQIAVVHKEDERLCVVFDVDLSNRYGFIEEGHIKFSYSLNEDEIGNRQEIEIPLIGKKSVTVTITENIPKVEEPPRIKKAGIYQDGIITWTVDVIKNSEKYSTDGLYLEDCFDTLYQKFELDSLKVNGESVTVVTGSALVGNSVSPAAIAIRNTDGQTGKEEGTTVTGAAIRQLDNGLSCLQVSLEALEKGDVTITYLTSLSSAVFANDSGTFLTGEIQIVNKARLIDENGTVIRDWKEAAVTVNREWITKNGVRLNNSRKIQWTVTVDSCGMNLADIQMYDRMAEGLWLLPDSVKIQYEGGAAAEPEKDDITIVIPDRLKESHYVKELYTDTEYNTKFSEQQSNGGTLENGYVLQLGTLQGNCVITYETEIDKDLFLKNTTIEAKNDVWLELNWAPGQDGDMKPYFIPSVGKTMYVPTNLLVKSFKGYDTEKHQLIWDVTLNQYHLNLTNVELTDIPEADECFVPDSVTGAAVRKADGTQESTKATGSTDEAGKITFQFSGDVAGTDQVSFQFRTELTESAAEKYSKNGTSAHINRVHLDAEVDGKVISVDSQASGNYVSEVLKKEGAGYDYQTRETAWRITVNHNKMPAKDVTVTDIIPLGSELSEESVKIWKDGNDVTNTFAVSYDEKSRELSIPFSEIQEGEEFIITYLTVLDVNHDANYPDFALNKDVAIENEARIELTTTQVFSEKAVGTQPIENRLLDKTANYKTGNDYIDYSVLINQHGLELRDLDNKVITDPYVLKDVIPTGLLLDTSSIVLYHVKMDRNGVCENAAPVTLSKEQVKFDLETNTLTLTLPPEIVPYKLEYRVYVEDRNQQSFTNTISFGALSSANSDGSVDHVVINDSSASASGKRRGTIVISKKQTNSSNMVEGAKFNLLDSYGNIIQSGKTDKEGKLSFKVTCGVKYSVEEIEAPEHFKPVTSENGKREDIIVSDADPRCETVNFENERIEFDIRFQKVDSDNSEIKLSGAQFALFGTKQDAETKDGTSLQIAVSGTDGTVCFKNLKYGTYYMKEVKAPEGYQLNSKIYEVNVARYSGTAVIKTDEKQIRNIVNEKIIASPSPTPTATVTPVPTPSAAPSPTVTVTPVPTPSVSPIPTVTVTPAPTPSGAPSPTVTVTPTPTPTPETTVTPIPTPGIDPDPGVTATPTPTPGTVPDPEVTVTPTPTPTAAISPTPTPEAVPTPSAESSVPAESIPEPEEPESGTVPPDNSSGGAGSNQSHSSITIVVRDEKDEVIADAVVDVYQKKNLISSKRSDEEGIVIFTDNEIPGGALLITVSTDTDGIVKPLREMQVDFSDEDVIIELEDMEVPLGVPFWAKQKLPQTGTVNPLWIYAAGAALMLAGTILLFERTKTKKKERRGSRLK